MTDPDGAGPRPLSTCDGVVAPPPAYDAAWGRAVRHRLGVSQRVFAAALNVSLGAVRAREQGDRTPEGASLRLLQLAETHPAIMREAITALGSGAGAR